MARILIVEDDEATSLLLTHWLESAHYDVECAATIAEMLRSVAQSRYDAVILDQHLSDGNSFEFLETLIKDRPNMMVIVLTGHGSVELAVEALRKGASGFITKPTSSERLLQELGRLMRNESLAENEGLGDSGIIGESPAMKKIFEVLNRVKDVNSTVLIQGESGTGKELIARALHRLSPRRASRFEAINCAAIPETLLEGELFGYMKGAFTDARHDRKGLFEVCNSGTLFLDEIADLPITLQAKLLRVLQEREIMPLGSQKSIKINTRIVAASNKKLAREVEAGRFRPDLYYRLSVVELTLPPLRERTEDIPLLARAFLRSLCERFGKELAPLSPEILARMILHRWPGNIRELQNSLERAVVLADGHVVAIDDVFPQDTFDQIRTSQTDDGSLTGFRRDIGSLEDERSLFEIHYIRQLLTMTNGNMSLAAKKAGKFRADLYRLLGKYRIDPATFRNKGQVAPATR